MIVQSRSYEKYGDQNEDHEHHRNEKKNRRTALFLGFCVFLTGCAKLPDDGADAKVMRFDNLRDVRYAEVFLIGGDALTHNLEAAFYNTTGLNNSEDPRNTAPKPFGPRSTPRRSRSNTTCWAYSRTVRGTGRWTGSNCRWERSATSMA